LTGIPMGLVGPMGFPWKWERISPSVEKEMAMIFREWKAIVRDVAGQDGGPGSGPAATTRDPLSKC